MQAEVPVGLGVSMRAHDDGLRSAWGIRVGDKLASGPPKLGICRPGEGAVVRVAGRGEFTRTLARFPVDLPDGERCTMIVDYDGNSSTAKLVR
jgi:hypothetical protein